MKYSTASHSNVFLPCRIKTNQVLPDLLSNSRHVSGKRVVRQEDDIYTSLETLSQQQHLDLRFKILQKMML